MNISAPHKVNLSKSKASNQDLQKFIDEGIRISNGQVGNGFAKKLNGGSERKTAENIHKFLRKNTKYVKDGQLQVIKSARSLIKDKKGDCKSYSVFASSVLTKNGIPHSLAYTSYNNDPTPSHVYVQTDGGYVIDAVLPKFNQEAPYTYKHKKKVRAKLISGIGGYHSKIDGIHGTKKKRTMIHKANVPLLFVPRAIVLGLLKINLFGLATLINWRIASAWEAWKREKGQGVKQYPPYLDSLSKTWYNLGGRTTNWYLQSPENKLAKAISEGAGTGKAPNIKPKKPLGLVFLKLLPSKIKSQLLDNLKACGRALEKDPNWDASAVRKYFSTSYLNKQSFPTEQEQQQARKIYNSYVSKSDQNSIEQTLNKKEGINGIGAAGGGIGEAIVGALPVLLPLLYSALGGNQPSDEDYTDLMDDAVRSGSYPSDVKEDKTVKASLAALGGEFVTPLAIILGTAFLLNKTKAFK